MGKLYSNLHKTSKIFNIRSLARMLFAMLVFILLFTEKSNATHMRYGNISWSWVSGNTVTFHISQSWRRSFYVPAPNLGSTESTTTINFGDGQTAPVVITTTAINTTSDWFYGEATVTHTYATGGTYTATIGECCRLNTLQNNANLNDLVSSVVNLHGDGDNGPVSTLQPIVNLPTGTANASFTVPAFDPDGDGITYALSTPAQMGGTTLKQPTGFSINPTTGVVTWSTVGHAVGQLWNASITITDGHGSTTTDDFLIQIVNQSNPPYFDYSVTPANAYTYHIIPGQNLTFNVKAADNTQTDLVTLQALGLPVGATMVHALPFTGNPVQSTFSWTPTVNQLGALVVQFLAQDANGVQVATSVNIVVSYDPVFDSPPTPADSSSFCIAPGTPYTGTIQFHSPDPGMPLRITSATIPSGATLTPSVPTAPGDTVITVINWTPRVSDWGPHWLSFTATDTFGRTTTSTFEIVVNSQPSFGSSPPSNLNVSVNQPFVYNISINDPDLSYGDISEIAGISLPSWLTLEETGETGQAVLSGVPGSANVGVNPVQLQASDSFDHCFGPVNQFFNINVTACNLNAQITPVISGPYCPGQSVQLMASAAASYAWSTGDTSQTINVTAGAATQYTVTVISGTCAATATYTLNGTDNTPPVAVAKNITVTLVGNSATITAANVDGGSSDNCGIASRTLSQYSFNGSNLGPNTVTLTVTDASGNSSTATAIVTVVDNTPPVAVCKNITATLVNGSVTISPADVDGGSTDNAGIASRALSQTTFTCSDVGQNNVTLTVMDASGNSALCIATVTVVDNTPPVAVCQNITVPLVGGTASVQASDVDGGSTSPCGIATSSVSPSAFTCANLGANNVTLTVTDASGNSASCNAVVTVVDNTPPVTVSKNIQIYLNNGTANIAAADVDGGSSDNCSIVSETVSPSTFGVSNIGSNIVTLTTTDASGNSSSSNAIVTVIDSTHPGIITRNITMPLSGHSGTIMAPDVIGGTNDPAGIAYSSVYPDSFDCSNLGQNTVLITVTDSAGNTSTVTAIVTVVDTTLPVAVCQNITIALVNGSASITASQVDGGSSDNCGIASENVSPSSFDCSNIGANTVTLTVTDASGNSSSCNAIVTIIDNTAPVAVCQNITIPLINGSASISAADVDGGSSDDCGIASETVSPWSFTCANLGDNAVTLTITDASGNAASCNAIVTVIDNTAPVAVCQNITVALSNGSASISAANVDGGSTDDCGIVSSSVAPSSFDCSSLGENVVVFTVTDGSGNSSSCEAIVTVIDNNPPVAVCKNITIALVGSSANISAADVDGGSSDDCGIAAMSVSPSSFDCSSLGANQVQLTVTDAAGNSSSCNAVVTVVDNTPPVAVCKNIFVELNGGAVSIAPADVDGGSSDNCGIVSSSVSPNVFDCSNLGINSVTLTVTDASGNSSSCNASVTIIDNTPPVAVCQNITVALHNGAATITAANVDGGSTDDCGIAASSISQSSFTCADIGSHNITLTVTDASGNSSSCNAIVTVADNNPPTAVCRNITVALNGNSANISAADVDGGSSDDCGIVSSSVYPSAFNCSNLGPNQVTLTLTGLSGLTSSCNATVTVIDTTAPVAICKNITIPLFNGSASITAADLDGGSSDNCGIASESISQSSFTCANLGNNNVTFTVTDASGNSSSCSAIVTVINITPPVAVCKNITIALVGNSASISAADVDGGSTDQCGIASRTISQSIFTCANLGDNEVVFTVADASGNSSTCNAIVTVVDNTPPVAVCKNITVALSGNSASINAADVDGGSSDNCAVASMSVSPSSFDCSNLGDNLVTLTVSDASGNTSSCNAHVTIIDNTAPVAICQNITVALSGGSANITAAQVDGGSSDNCHIASRSVSPSSFTCANLGANSVTLTVTDEAGNSSSCNATVTVVDNTPPVAICRSIQLTLTGATVSITVDSIDNGSYDNCGIASRSISKSIFGVLDIGANNVTLTVTDASGNSSSCNATVTIVSLTPPNVICKNATVVLNGSSASITPASLDGGSTAPAGIASRSVSQSSFNCSNVGANTVTFSIHDSAGNTYSCNAIVTVLDNTPPVAVCKNITVPLVGGSATITAAQVDGGSSDNCSIASRSISQSNFTCANLGANTVTLTVTDPSGNSASCNAIVTVVDNTPPVALTKNITVLMLHATLTITPDQIDNGSSDNCSIVSRTVSPSIFTCSNLGDNNVTLTVTDEAGNTSSSTCVVTIEDHTLPLAIGQNITVYLDATGHVSITGAQVDGGSTPYCGIANRSVSPSTFSCSNIGANVVTLTVSDFLGNTSSTTAIVTVLDNTPPTAVCKNITVPLVGASATITSASIDGGSTDNCGIVTRTISASSFTCANLGANFVTLTLKDASGNTSSCTSTVTVVDNTPPTAICKNITVTLSGGVANITAAQLDNGSFDNCSIASRTISQSSFNCANLGHNNVTLTITDGSGNSSSCTAVVTVLNSTPPVALAKNITVALGSNGTVTITAAQVDNGSSDNCGIATRTVTPSTFTCANLGANSVTLTVADASGNSASATATVTIIDNLPPVAVCKNVTVPLIGTSATITASTVDGGSTDNCGIASRTISKSSFTNANLGANSVTLTVKDASGNSSTCTAIVTVVDNTAPVAVCKSITVALNSSGNATITASQVDGGSTDNCGIATRTISMSSFTCANLGVNHVTLTVKDASGNSSSCTANVTVVDNTAPVAVCKNISVSLVNGQANITALQVDGGSTDNCGIATRTVSRSNFTCANLGANSVVLTVKDASGNSSSCTAVVTVVGANFTATVTSVPTDTTYTGGDPTTLYLGYGAQSTHLNVSANGGAPYTYSWSCASGLTGTSTSSALFSPGSDGTYTFHVTVTNTYGCSASASISIDVEDVRDNGKVIICHYPPGNPNNNQTLSVASSAVAAHLRNHPGDHLGPCYGADNGGHDGDGGGDGDGHGGDGGGCKSLTGDNDNSRDHAKQNDNQTNITSPNAVLIPETTVYPNPFGKEFHLQIAHGNGTNVTVRLYDIAGNLMQIREGVGPDSEIVMGSGIANGVYIIEVTQGTTRKVLRIIKSQ